MIIIQLISAKLKLYWNESRRIISLKTICLLVSLNTMNNFTITEIKPLNYKFAELQRNKLFVIKVRQELSFS